MTQDEIIEKVKNSAFPQTINHQDFIVSGTGLTKREYFAAMAMQGYIANGLANKTDNKTLAIHSVTAANALIEALNK